MKKLLNNILQKGIRLVGSEDHLKVLLGDEELTQKEKEDLSHHKHAILNWLQGRRAATLSYSQERLWFLEQLGYGFQYHIPSLGKIKGPLNIEALKVAIHWVVARHEALRTNFEMLEGVAVQLIAPQKNIPLVYDDLTLLEKNEKEQRKEALIREVSERPFDLQRDDLLRTHLIRIDTQEYILCLCLHHIISDGWSMKVLLAEIKQAYEAHCQQKNLELAPLKVQYTGYSAWQKKYLKPETLATAHQYWKQHLQGYNDLELPTDYPRPAQLSGKGGHLLVDLPVQLGTQIKQLCRQQRTTPFTLLIAAVYTLLSRYSGQKDFCLGIPVANRNHPDLEKLIGFFVNTLALRLNPDQAQPTVQELLRYVHQCLVNGQDHQNLPIENVLEFLQPERNLSRTPVFQVLINYVPAQSEEIIWGDCILTPLIPKGNGAKFDLTFGFYEKHTGEILLTIEYASDLFKEETIRRMSAQLEKLLQQLTTNLDTTVHTLDMLTTREKEQWKEWNNTKVNYPKEKCIHELFEVQAQGTPDQVAVQFEAQCLTYAQLNEASTTLAIGLQQLGVLPDTLVGICLPRSLEMIIALFGILKAGAAYLPIDARHPEDRINWLFADSEVSLVVTTNGLQDKLNNLPDGNNCRILTIDQLIDQARQSNRKLVREVSPPDLAYVMYTSGSTGKPKGVMVTHQSVVNHHFAAIDLYQLSSQDNVLQFSTISFDIFVEEVFPTLLTGATLILMDEIRFTDPVYLQQTIKQHRVSVVNFPTAYWHTLSAMSFADTNLRLVVIGGEQVEKTPYKQWRQNHPNVQVINTYGPTETTVIASTYLLGDEVEQFPQIPIGQPIPNVQWHILDKHDQPVPPGVPGELYIAGAGLARGYWKDQSLTQEKFITHPSDTSLRLYKTGDWVKCDASGQLVYLGRVDHQVKIRGFRVEPGEIEQVLMTHPKVLNMVVIAQKVNKMNQLVAYFIADEHLNSHQLSSFAKEHLPEYMVPMNWHQLEQLPLTANGKIDRKKLTQQQVTVTKSKFTPSQTATEKALQQLWQEMLKAEQIGIEDNFFELGGHSLLAIQLVNTINKRWPMAHMQVIDLMRQPTIRALASKLEDAPSKTTSQGSYLTHLRSSTPTFIVPGLPGLSDNYLELAQCLPNRGSVYGLQMKGFTQGEPAQSIEEMAAHNVASIQQVQKDGKINLYAHSYGGTVLHEMLHQLEHTSLEAEDIVLMDCGIFQKQDVLDRVSVSQFYRVLLDNTKGSTPDVFNQIASILKNALPHEWKAQLTDLVAQLNLGLDATFLTNLWEVVETALKVDYEYKTLSRAYVAKFVIAEESKNWLLPHSWDAHYAQVEVLYANGGHYSMLRKNHCQQWINQL